MLVKKVISSLISWVFIGGLAYASFAQIYGQYAASHLQQGSLNVQVAPLAQSLGTSCGEAVITMAYNYAYPQTPTREQDVIDYATAQGYFTEAVSPYTSPANMVRIANYYADEVSSGNVINSGHGLFVLIEKLHQREPILIDVLSNFKDPQSEAHFILVTGISVDPNRDNAIVIQYNDPLTGGRRSADWAGAEGVWNAWRNNGDPGGSGWWLVISPPE